jgi:hypothetical protein
MLGGQLVDGKLHKNYRNEHFPEVEMIKANQTGIGLILSALALSCTSSAMAQVSPQPSGSTSTSPSASMMMNPYYNPYMNPLLNPGASQQQMTTGNALLYMYAANSARGGIGSGRLSNPGTSATARKRPANMPNSASRPGGGAARFFNPGPVNTNGAGRYFNQRGRNFMNTGN